MKSYFSENLKAIRKYKKITLEELSEAITVSKSAISDYENNKFSPSIFICRKIADFFDVSIDSMEYSEILEKNQTGKFEIKDASSLSRGAFAHKQQLEDLEKIKLELKTDLILQKQKVDGLQVQFRLQEQLKDSKLSEIELLKTQIGLLEDKIKLIS